jgi:nitrogen fixation NifU-like protein
MSGLEDLYREIILDHYRSPRNRGELEVPPARRVEGFNPLCGDEIVVYLLVADKVVSDIRISGQGCSISQSSASMMSAAVKGKSVDEARQLIASFKAMMSIHEHAIGGDGEAVDGADGADGGVGAAGGDGDGFEPGGADSESAGAFRPALSGGNGLATIPAEGLGELAALQGVVKFPVRIKCATLSWNTLAQGLDEAAADAGSQGSTGSGGSVGSVGSAG